MTKRESFPGLFAMPRSAAAPQQVTPSPVSMLADALDEHFEQNEPHFCKADCTEDLLTRMNNREVFIVSRATLASLHTPCQTEITWYRDALVTIMDGTSSLKPEIVARIALERMDEADT